MPRIDKYDLRDENGIRWYRLHVAPLDFLIDPGFYIRDTRVAAPPEHGIEPDEREGIGVGPYRVRLLLPQLYFDHGTPEWAQRLRSLVMRSQ